MHSLRLSGGTSTGLGRFAGLAAAARGGRRASVSAAPPPPPLHPRDDVHPTTIEDVMSQPPFGVAYSTRSDEEGFGGVYTRDDDQPAFKRPTAEAHPSHSPPPDSQVEEKARHLKHAT